VDNEQRKGNHRRSLFSAKRNSGRLSLVNRLNRINATISRAGTGNNGDFNGCKRVFKLAGFAVNDIIVKSGFQDDRSVSLSVLGTAIFKQTCKTS
jgi:hypothetical protein